LTGNFDARGGNMLLPAPASAPITGETLPGAKHRPPPVGADLYPLGPAAVGSVSSRDLYRAILHGNRTRCAAWSPPVPIFF
jgi:hypothetical protein